MSWRRVATAFACASIVPLLSGCSIGGPDVSAGASCDGPAFTSDKTPAAAAETLILIELARNDDDARDAVVQAIDPTVSRAVAEGGVVRLLVGGGEGEPIVKSPCLDGASVIFVDRNNDETERRDRSAAVNAIEGDVKDLLKEKVEIAEEGDLTNLLAAVPDELSSLAAGRGAEAGAPVTVLLVSDLNSKAPDGDCLGLEKLHATQEIADELVSRCLQAGQFQPLPHGVGLEIVRPQLISGEDANSQLSVYLKQSLCAQLSGKGGKCVAGAAKTE